jgi:antirestriction protein ArdC
MANTAAETKVTQRFGGEPRDYRREVTDQIITMLENGVAPWQKPWNPAEAAVGMPVNPTTDRNYRGGNALHLLATALKKGYGDPRWLTYKQAADNGWQVRRGEKGTQIEFWEVKPANKEVSRGDDSDTGGGQTRQTQQDTRLVHRVYTVFNARQIDGIPEYQPARPTPFQVVSSAEKILENSGAKISHDQSDWAFYSRASDSIHLPPKASFKDAAGYYGTALHELAHWSGHPSRLDRATLNDSYRFGDVNYAKEELRAELASVFLAAERGIPHDPEQDAAYVGAWIQALRQDKHEIFRAAHDASAATDFLLALERDRSIADQSLSAGPAPTSRDSGPVTLDEQTQQLERDREDELEADGGLEAGRAPDYQTPAAPVRESTTEAARWEPGSGTVAVEKQGGTARHSPVETRAAPTAPNGTPAADELNAARAIAAAALGASARTVEALVESGAYRGLVIGETEHYTVQRQSSQTAVLHRKDLLDRQPEPGATVAINYSNAQGVVRDAKARDKAQEVGR